ncbi:thiamine diphosphokinase [Senegalia sp. (in: firmicutes)]|uniref:thiamine diphosphokinase n=1 Tax=Senegalia sp. (in: firmicutes) TaxID=1924098 RepID=UPI003F957EC7
MRGDFINILIIGGGNFIDKELALDLINNADKIIAADGAGKYLYELNRLPDVLIGDFDTLEANILEYFRKKDVDIHEFLPVKDKSDLELAIDLATEYSAKEIIIIGALGSRMDHSLSNIMLLFHILEKGIEVKMIDDKNEIMPIKNEIKIKKGKYEYISLLPILEDLDGVELIGLEYEFSNLKLKRTSTRGISNRFKEKEAKIKVKSGMGLVILSND